MPYYKPVVERILKRRLIVNECWIYTGATTSDGYGSICVENKTHSVHRYYYELIVSKIPDGLTIDHLCHVKACFNPAHLEVVTRSENIKRAHNKKTCRRQHLLIEENIYVGPDKRKRCRECIKLRVQKKYLPSILKAV